MSQPWSSTHEELPEKPVEHAFGYVDGSGWHAATRETLEARVRSDDPPVAVWTPDAPRLQLTAEVPWLRAAMAEAAAARPRSRAPLAWAAVGAVVAALGLAGLAPPTAVWVGGGCLVIAALLVATDHTRRRQATRSLTPESIAATRAAAAHESWIRAQPVTYTNHLAWIIGACAVAQMVAPGSIPGSIERAGLVPSAVRAGEWWRLATAALLHGDPLHFFLNIGALLAFARMLEVHAHRAYVPLVFLLTAIAASLASFLLPPETTSIGASGGIMGLVGSLIALGTLRARVLPAHFTRSLWTMVGATALLGLFGYAFIDNSAHLGGFVAGLACGAMLLPFRATERVTPGRVTIAAGTASLGLLALTALWAIARMLL